MATYAQILMYAIPGFFLLIFVEWIVSWVKGVQVFTLEDTISSLSSGMTNAIKDVLGLTIIIISYQWMFDRVSITSVDWPILGYVLAFVALDFAGYWSHRWEHTVNIFWNRHIIHHSSEEFNMACALRQNISSVFALFTFLLLPAALIGVPPKVIAVVGPLHLFAQFWYHTRLIDKMGWLEYIIVTPSHHRVHHAINDLYLDKNYSQVFIVWDKLFGTFQPELSDIPPVYGVKRAVRTWNPILINFQHLALIASDAWHTRSWIDKFKVWWKPTGYRPHDVADTHPIDIITDPYQYDKYRPNLDIKSKVWATVQFFVTMAMMLHLFSVVADFEMLPLLYYGLFLLISVYAYTSFMDGSKEAIWAELLRLILGISMVYGVDPHGSWYGVHAYIMIAYLLLSMTTTWYLNRVIQFE